MGDNRCETSGKALFIFASWITSQYKVPGLNRNVIEKFRSLKMKHGVHTNIYSTVLDVEVTESQRKEAEGSGVILIPARRKANLDPKKYPPNLDWLINHEIYYPKLKDLTGVLYVVGSDPLTKDAAKDIRENIFPSAELILLGSSVPQAAGVLVVFDRWDITKCGLAHFHRALVKNVRERLGEFLKLYATILDADISGVEKKDAEDAGVTLIPASRNESIDPTDDPIGVHYLFYHKGYYPHLRDLKNIKYVVGYAPMTANAAADIRKSLFPSAKLFQINQLNPENFCKLKNGDSSKLVKKMVNIAREADAVASIGPGMHDYFENAYRAITDKNIAHIEILPNFGEDFAIADIKLPENVRHHTLLSYGVTCTGEDGAVDEYETIADAVGKVATTMQGLKHPTPKWNLLGVTPDRNEALQIKITEKMNCKFLESRIMPDCSPADLMDKLLTSHLCIIGQCQGQYGLYGLESITAGLPTLVSEKADLGCLMNRYFEDHAPMFVVRREEDWSDKISFTLSQTNVAFKSANKLKKAYVESTAVKDCCARFSSLFTEASTPSEDLDVTITLDDQPWQDRFTDIEKRIDVLSHQEPIDKSAITALQDDMRQTLEALKRCQQGLKRKADEIVDDDSQPLKFVCRNADLGINNITQTKSGSLRISFNFLGTLQLYKFKSGNRNGRFSGALEPFLISDSMLQEALKVNISLKLKVSYDQVQFDAIDNYFITRRFEMCDGVPEQGNTTKVHRKDQHGSQTLQSGTADCATVASEVGSLSQTQFTLLIKMKDEAIQEKSLIEDRYRESLRELDTARSLITEKESVISALEEKVKDCENKITELTDNIQAFEALSRVAHDQDKQDEIKALQDQVDKYKNDISSLEEQVKQYQTETEKAENLRHDTSLEMTLLRGQLSNKEQECSNLKSQLEGSQRENVPGAYSKRIHERIERAGTLISLKRVEIASLADQIHSRELEISSLEQRLESCQNKLEDLGDQFISGTIEQPAVESQYQQTFKLLEESEKQILSKETTINVLREQIAQLQNEITLLKKQSIDVV